MIVPHDGDIWTEPVFAGSHRLNGNGELTGLEWIREAGLLTGPIGITNTHSVGVVRDGIIRNAVRKLPFGTSYWALPVVGETWDGLLNDIDGFHVTADHVDQALAAATDGAVAEGNVGGGTGMVCHEFKGGIGTASRVVAERPAASRSASSSRRTTAAGSWLRVDGVPVGEAIPVAEVPSPYPDDDDDDGHGRPAIVRRARRRPAPARSSSSSRPTRRSCPTSASGSPSGPASASPGWAGPAPIRAATCSSASRPATARCRGPRSGRIRASSWTSGP